MTYTKNCMAATLRPDHGPRLDTLSDLKTSPSKMSAWSNPRRLGKATLLAGLLSPMAALAQIPIAGGHLDCNIPLELPVRGNVDADPEPETLWVPITAEVRDLLFDGCENTVPAECADNLDNDGDGLIDDLDPGCSDGTELPLNDASSPEIDFQHTANLGESQWLPFSQYYNGDAACAGIVEDLPPGMVRDSVCNIYGTPNTVGSFLTTVQLNNDSQWTIRFTVIGDAAPPPPPPDPIDFRITLALGVNKWLPIDQYYGGAAACAGVVAGLPPGMARDSVCNIYGVPTTAGVYVVAVDLDDASQWQLEITVADPTEPDPVGECSDGLDNDGDGYTDGQDPGCGDGTELPDDSVSPPPPGGGFTSVRSDIPATPADGPYPPQALAGGERWSFQKIQLANFARDCSVNGADCWRYDPVKTLHEHCRKAQMLGEQSEACALAPTYGEYFLARQHWGESGAYPDCSGGAELPGGADKCDPKYGAHASVAYYQGVSYTPQQQQQMKEYCYTQGWSFGPVTVDGLEDGFTERVWGLALQCLIDLAKQGVDTQAERGDYIDKLYAMFSGDYSGQVLGAPVHSMDGHECSNYCPNLDYWMFSPWMGSAFLIPALWEHWVFLEKDPRIAEMIVMFGDAMMEHGLFDPDVTGYGFRMAENPTPWVTHYFAVPYDEERQAQDQVSEGGYSDLHNPESIFALSAAYFFSCNADFKARVDEMYPFFNDANAQSVDSPQRIYLWANRGSASTEWLLENAACPTGPGS